MNVYRPPDANSAAQMVTVREAKMHLSRLLAPVEVGEEIVIARGAPPSARIVPLVPARPKRRVPGWLAYMVPHDTGDILSYGFRDPPTDDEMGLAPDARLDP